MIVHPNRVLVVLLTLWVLMLPVTALAQEVPTNLTPQQLEEMGQPIPSSTAQPAQTSSQPSTDATPQATPSSGQPSGNTGNGGGQGTGLGIDELAAIFTQKALEEAAGIPVAITKNSGGSSYAVKTPPDLSYNDPEISNKKNQIQQVTSIVLGIAVIGFFWILGFFAPLLWNTDLLVWVRHNFPLVMLGVILGFTAWVIVPKWIDGENLFIGFFISDEKIQQLIQPRIPDDPDWLFNVVYGMYAVVSNWYMGVAQSFLKARNTQIIFASLLLTLIASEFTVGFAVIALKIWVGITLAKLWAALIFWIQTLGWDAEHVFNTADLFAGMWTLTLAWAIPVLGILFWILNINPARFLRR